MDSKKNPQLIHYLLHVYPQCRQFLGEIYDVPMKFASKLIHGGGQCTFVIDHCNTLTTALEAWFRKNDFFLNQAWRKKK